MKNFNKHKSNETDKINGNMANLKYEKIKHKKIKSEKINHENIKHEKCVKNENSILINNKFKVFFYGLFVVIWMGVIFLYSSQNADKSGASSSGLTHFILNALTQLGIISACNITQSEFIKTEGTIRTLAHFTEYFIFGIITFNFASYTIAKSMLEKFIYPFIFCVLYAVTDEIHQYYVPGRAMQLEDWLVDSSGILVGILLILFIVRINYKKDK